MRESDQSPEASDEDQAGEALEIPLRRIRQTVAINHFKWSMLGDAHVPGDPQSAALFRVASDFCPNWDIDSRTWAAWFGQTARRARGDALGCLDRCRSHEHEAGRPLEGPNASPGPGFYVNLVQCGLAEVLLQPSSAKLVHQVLHVRALDYKVPSAWHLHLDAIEAAALSICSVDTLGDDPGRIAAARVSTLLHDRWGPRSGTIYDKLTSTFAHWWAGANGAEREQARKSRMGFHGDLLQADMTRVPTPRWKAIGVGSDISAPDIHKLMFCLAAEAEFLVADRFDAWALDLVSAGLAVYAFAQTDPCASNPLTWPPELQYWGAIQELFFGDPNNEELLPHLRKAMKLAGGPWTSEVGQVFLKARDTYWSLLQRVGLSANIIASAARLRHPWEVIFVGGA